MGGITTDPIYIRITIMEYKQIYVHKFYNLDEIDQVLESYKLPKLTKEIDKLNVSIFISKTKFLFQNLPKINKQINKCQAQVISLENSNRHLKRNNTKFSQKPSENRRVVNVSCSFYEASINLIPKP